MGLNVIALAGRGRIGLATRPGRAYQTLMTETLQVDDVQFCRPRHLPEVELVSVAYRDRRFPEHHHDEFVIGAITAGAEELTLGRHVHLADRGSVLRLRPREAHANATLGDEILRYAVLYIPGAILERHFDGPPPTRLGFASPVVRSPRLHRIVCEVHGILASRTSERLEQESAIGRLAEAIGLEPASADSDLASPAAVERARQHIDAHYAESFGLDELSRLAGVSPFHLVRTFKKVVGVSPLAYRNQRRLAAARRRLAAGQSTIQIALELGYADQSHFTRQFQRVVGISPRRYALGIAGPPR